MPERISRRALLSGAIKAGVGLAVWKELNLGAVRTFAISPAKADGGRFQSAFARLDEFITAHMRDIG